MAKIDEAIISIKPAFAEAILDGEKTVELRRRIPPVQIGARLWIYATRPLASIVGTATIDTIYKGTPQAVWEIYSDRIAINRKDFDHYFEGAVEAIGIRLSSVRRLQPIGIDQLRVWKQGFHPPQVLSSLTKAEANALVNISSSISEPKNSIHLVGKFG